MAIITKFYSWQDRPERDWANSRWDSCSPNLLKLSNYLIKRWDGQYLGCPNNRSIVGGSSPSSHSYGAALDWRYEDPGMGRDKMLKEVIPWLINNSQELGIQAIHDYVGSRVWRPPGTSGRAAGSHGWRKQATGEQMGQSWALWLHIEVHIDHWSDNRSVEDKLKTVVTPPKNEDQEEEDMVMGIYIPKGNWVQGRNLAWFIAFKSGIVRHCTGPDFWAASGAPTFDIEGPEHWNQLARAANSQGAGLAAIK